MPHICLDERKFHFPKVDEANEEGLLVIGGKVTPARVIEAYPKGIFPWYSEEELPLWWSPDPRFVLFPAELHISRSMQKLISKNVFDFRIDTAFEDVIHHCATANRKEQNGTWLTKEMKDVYIQLHHLGYAHSAETWKDGKLVGPGPRAARAVQYRALPSAGPALARGVAAQEAHPDQTPAQPRASPT